MSWLLSDWPPGCPTSARVGSRMCFRDYGFSRFEVSWLTPLLLLDASVYADACGPVGNVRLRPPWVHIRGT
eukprot:11120027-Alexandrium_andersonii.AAC.1